MHLQEIKNIFHIELDAVYAKEEVASFFYILIEHYLGLPRFVLALEPDKILTKEEESPLFLGLARLKLEEPIQYIVGTAHFMDMEFVVNENVLIPRPETEELVRWIHSTFSGQNSALHLLDIGTGSGCIAISLAKQFPNAKIYAVDISEKALEVAKKNAVLNNVKVHFMEADILKPLLLKESFDIIVSNPPYVRELEKKEIRNNVKNREPQGALFVSDKDPLIFYKAILHFAKTNLVEGGTLYFEINQYLAKETQQLLEDQNFSEIVLRKDLFGNHRMIKGRLM